MGRVIGELLEWACSARYHLRLLFAGGMTGLVLIAVSLLVLEPGTETYAVAIVDLIGLVVLTAGTALILRVCRDADV